MGMRSQLRITLAIAAGLFAAAPPAIATPVTRVKAVGSRYGTILADGRGQAFYVFGRERTRRSECYGACAAAWPPALAKGRPVAGKGARASLIGTTRRRDGRRQVTYRGRPLYYYVADTPGRVLCQNVREFGGLWQVVRPDGIAVR
jgi:predicted lipoprotein with Yx(FWY)xxD motif